LDHLPFLTGVKKVPFPLSMDFFLHFLFCIAEENPLFFFPLPRDAEIDNVSLSLFSFFLSIPFSLRVVRSESFSLLFGFLSSLR